MDIVEFIGFLIAMAVLIISAIQRKREQRDRKEHPEKYAEKERQQEEALRRFLKSMDIQLDESELGPPKPPPPPKAKKPPPRPPAPVPMVEESGSVRRPSEESFTFQSRIETRKKESRIEKKRLETHVEERSGADLVHISPHEAPRQSVHERRQDAYDRRDRGAYQQGDYTAYDRMDEGAYAIRTKERRTRVTDLLKRSASRRDIILLSEILGKPKSLQD